MEKQIKKYKTYEDYLDSLMVEEDQKYLGDVETARQLVQLGYRSSGKTLTRQVQLRLMELINIQTMDLINISIPGVLADEGRTSYKSRFRYYEQSE